VFGLPFDENRITVGLCLLTLYTTHNVTNRQTDGYTEPINAPSRAEYVR